MGNVQVLNIANINFLVDVSKFKDKVWQIIDFGINNSCCFSSPNNYLSAGINLNLIFTIDFSLQVWQNIILNSQS